jgi:hypothetical protein
MQPFEKMQASRISEIETGIRGSADMRRTDFPVYDSDPRKITLCRNRHEQSVHTQTMKIDKPWHDGFPPQGLFRGTVGQCGDYPYAYRH